MPSAPIGKVDYRRLEEEVSPGLLMGCFPKASPCCIS